MRTHLGSRAGSPQDGGRLQVECRPHHLPTPGVPAAAAPVFDLTRDPREERPLIGAALWSGASFQDMAKRHMMMQQEYPHLPIGKGVPYEGIDNLRPETKDTVATFMSWH